MTNNAYDHGFETDRLITRKLTENDIEAWAEFFKSSEATEFLPMNATRSPLERSGMWIEKQLNRYRQKTYGLQALIHKRTREFVGQCGLLTQDLNGNVELEVGYHIIRKYWGQGFAPEASRPFIDYAFRNNLAGSVISIIDVRNAKSKRVAEKNGLEVDYITFWNNLEVEIFRITREKWTVRNW